MIIRTIGNDRLCVLLDDEELAHFSLTAEELGEETPYSRRVLLRILSMVRKRVKFNPGSDQLLVQVFPWEDGCALYFAPALSRQEEEPPKLEGGRLLFVFDELEDLLEGAVGLFSRYCHRVYKSSLYHLQGRWWLLLSVFNRNEERIPAFVSEYGTPVTRKGADVHLQEHGRLIILDNAIDKLAYYLGPSPIAAVPTEEETTIPTHPVQPGEAPL